MYKGRKILYTLIFIFLLIVISPINRAQTAPLRPSFPKCTSPQGLTKVNYPEGVHGIPGDSASYSGTDTVYELSETTLTQCFCSTNGSGIQTNWWKISSLSFSEVEELKKLGWVYVPDGSEWGLQQDPYMALSSSYICKSTNDDGDDDEDHDDRKNNEDDNDDSGEVLGISTFGEVLGLASTGNSTKIALYASIAIFSLGGLIYLIKFKNS